MATQKEIANLARIYLASRDRLLHTIINYQGVGTKVYANSILQHLNRELANLQKASNKFIDTSIPAEYQKGLDDVYGYFKRNGLMMNHPSMFANIHTDAVYQIAREMQYQIGSALAQVGKRTASYVNTARDQAIRDAALSAAGEKAAGGETIVQMKNNLIKKLQQDGFMTVQYGNSHQVSLDSYAMMTARSTTREAGNMARENQLTTNGYDLVEMTTHYPTCEICAQLQGRIYSISGHDKRFPPLSEAFRNGYHNVHPNCRHSVVPFIESLQTPEELQAAIERSNQPFEDSRSQKEIELYQSQQDQNRRMRQDLYQYERYKTRLGDQAPKSFRAFRRMKKEGGARWDSVQRLYSAKAPGSDRFKVDGITVTKEALGKVYQSLPEDQLDVAMTAHEDTLQHGLKNGTEKIYAVNLGTGEAIMKDTGTKNQVSFSPVKLITAPKGSILFVHNHPGSSSFSSADLAIMNNFPSIKAVGVQGHNGILYSAEIGQGLRLDPADAADRLEAEFHAAYLKHRNAGDWAEVTHRACEEVCNMFGWTYRREKP